MARFCIIMVSCYARVVCSMLQKSDFNKANWFKTRVGKREITQCPPPPTPLSDSLTNKQ